MREERGEGMDKSARETAYGILFEVKYGKAYSNILLNQVLTKGSLSSADKGFVTDMVYGTLSRLYYLDYIIELYSNIRMSKISKKVRTILQMGAYQLLFMDGVADFAAVDETVRLTKALDFRAVGFVNAVMRAICREKEKSCPRWKNCSEIKDKKKHFSICYSVSEYLAGRLLKIYGEEFAKALLESFYEVPKLFIRSNPLKITAEKLAEKLEEEGVLLEAVPGMEGVFAAEGLRGIGRMSSFRKGEFSVQDISSMQAVDSLDPRPGERILDLCSAPGGKSFYIAEKMKNIGRVDAMDVSQTKLRLLSQRAEELGLTSIHTEISDACLFREDLQEQYDRVLVDAPCSGFGIIRRKPEIRYKNYEDVAQLPRIQKEILENASKYLKKGGRLLYSTCTLEKKENGDRIEEFLSEHPDFSPLSSPRELYPQVDGSDGFFIAVLQKEK